MIARLATAALLAVSLLATPAEGRDRRATVAGWRMQLGGSGDGGHLVRLSRRGQGYSFEHFLEFWRGNGGVVMGSAFRRGACGSGDAGAIVPYDQGMSRATFDGRLADYLRECPLPLAQEAMLRRTLDVAWPRFAALAEEALAAIEAENEAIVNHGRQD